MYEKMYEASGEKQLRVFSSYSASASTRRRRVQFKRLRYTDCGRLDCTVPPDFLSLQAGCAPPRVVDRARCVQFLATVSITGPVG